MVETNIDLTQFPITRYQGSKRRLLPWIFDKIKNQKFHTALDLFGGTASVSYLFKKMKKQVTYNDLLKCNYYIGKALIENKNVFLNNEDIAYLLNKNDNIDYGSFIQNTFRNVYYTDEENEFLDMVIKNIDSLKDRYNKKTLQYKKSMAYYALFQSCLIKRPFNLFHRKNLYIRTSEVKRNFGNKKTWDKSFHHYFTTFAYDANKMVFDNQEYNVATNHDAQKYPYSDYDLVYLDPPYVPIKNPYLVCNYYKNYHFLEGIVRYKDWLTLINYNRIHLPLKNDGYNWTHTDGNIKGIESIIQKFQDSIILISYKNSGIPTISDLSKILKQYKTQINIYRIEYSYALNKNNENCKEVLIIAK